MSREFKKGKIHDVKATPLRKFVDDRGWLAELWRTDNVEEQYRPVMTYISQTEPHVTRGPHEHVEQTDIFAFLGPGNFMLRVWDNRPSSPTYNVMETMFVGADNPMSVLIPPGVAHAYKNVSHTVGIVINSPNQLYRGKNYAEPIDEIRHEDDPDSPFKMNTH
ncbi:MAG: dTDP-4-dehydrorhamnose 3,5-epimerase family protein [bacterium]